jgi:hypothetical protein
MTLDINEIFKGLPGLSIVSGNPPTIKTVEFLS